MRPKLADLANPDKVITIDEATTVEACLSFVRDHHLLVGGSTGTVLAAVRQLSPEFSPADTIVAISPDLGDKYLDTVYDPAWVESLIAPGGRTPLTPNKENGAWHPSPLSTSSPDRQLRA